MDCSVELMVKLLCSTMTEYDKKYFLKCYIEGWLGDDVVQSLIDAFAKEV